MLCRVEWSKASLPPPPSAACRSFVSLITRLQSLLTSALLRQGQPAQAACQIGEAALRAASCTQNHGMTRKTEQGSACGAGLPTSSHPHGLVFLELLWLVCLSFIEACFLEHETCSATLAVLLSTACYQVCHYQACIGAQQDTHVLRAGGRATPGARSGCGCLGDPCGSTAFHWSGFT